MANQGPCARLRATHDSRLKLASSSISPLKSTLKKELGINNAQYAVLDTADSLINTILPIISGIAIDYYGPLAGSMYSSIVIVVGAILCGIAASISSYPLLVVGAYLSSQQELQLIVRCS